MKLAFPGRLALMGMMAIAFVAGTSVKGYADEGLLNKVKERGTLLVGLEGTYPPFSFQGDDGKLTGFEVKAFSVKHVEDLKCYGYLITTYGRTVYYSGDACEVPPAILKRLLEGRIEAVYQDTTEFWTPHLSHCPVELLADMVPVEYRKRVYCMHFSNDFSDKIKALGFNVVELSKKEGRMSYVSDGYTHSYERKQLLCESGC